MTAKKDPRIEAVAKLLFTGPLWGHNSEQWHGTDPSDFRDRQLCLMAAEDVLRGIDEAGEWEYGIQTVGAGEAYNEWRGFSLDDIRDRCDMYNSADTIRGYSMRSHIIRRRPAGEPEPLA